MRPEKLPIRPPSEWRSALVRVTRGCAWNRCKFCGIYPLLGEPVFSLRTTEEIKNDIDLIKLKFPNAETFFLGDADPVRIPLADFEEITAYLYWQFPNLKRLTSYARASTLFKLKQDGVYRLAKAGLNRVHIGLESGNIDVLKFHQKGLSPEILIQACEWLKEAGIEISLYVLLGLGGTERWKEHIADTAAVLNKVNPEFIRVRRLWLFKENINNATARCPLWDEIDKGTFHEQTAEGTVTELRNLIDGLTGIHSHFTCDHANNYVQVRGDLPGDKDAMLKAIDDFLALPKEKRELQYSVIQSTI